MAVAFARFLGVLAPWVAKDHYLVAPVQRSTGYALSDRVATATLDVIVPGLGPTLMAIGIMISTFGCNNGLILAGARVPMCFRWRRTAQVARPQPAGQSPST